MRRVLVLAALAAALATPFAPPAAAQCTHQVWTADPIAADDLRLYVVNSTPFPAGPTWSIEVCFTIANVGASPESASFTFEAWDDSNTDLAFPITGFRSESITTPGNAARAVCSTAGATVAQIETDGALAPNQLTDLCCFDFAAVPPGACTDLAGQTTFVYVPPPIDGFVFLRDRAWVMGDTGTNGNVLDEAVDLNPASGGPISGPGCGLLGLEAAVPLALAARRLRRARRAREAAR